MRHYAMPSPGDTLENFYMCAQLHSFMYALASKIGVKLKSF